MSDESDDQLHRLRRLCLSLPESWEKLSHGTPTFFAGKRVFAMFDNNHHNAGHIGVWLAAHLADQEMLIHTQPTRYYRPPYVGCKGWVGIELSEADDDVLALHLRQAWELIMRPPKKRSSQFLR
jgi:hypothetical protein